MGLKVQRKALCEALTASPSLDPHRVTAYSVLPESVTPPALFIGPGEPYLTRDGATFGGEVVNLAVTVVADVGVNDQRADDLDDLLEATLDALYALEGTDGFEWLTTRNIGAPGPLSLNGQDAHLAAVITVSVEIHRS